MAAVTGTSGNDTLRGTNSDDTIVGNGGHDTLNGLGGADTVNGGDGNDVIQGDGAYTLADAVRDTGRASVNYGGTAQTLVFTSMGKMTELDGDTVSVWRIRNGTSSDYTVTLKPVLGVSQTFVVAAKTDMFVTSTSLGTHLLLSNSIQIGVKAVSNETFTSTVAYGTTVEGNDTLSGGAGDDTIGGNGGDDTIDGGEGVDVIDGGNGNDVITGGLGNDKMFGGAGNDTFVVEWSDSGDYYDGGDGIDTFKADVVPLDIYVQEIDLATGTNNWQDAFVNIENVIGSNRNDKFWGTETANVLWGRLGDDLLDGRGGDDQLAGESGNDTLIGGAGADVLNGNDGDDSLAGDDGEDVLNGGAGGDTIFAGSGNDTLDGGSGNDLLNGGAGADSFNGGGNYDHVDYRTSSAGVNVNLVTGVGSGGEAEGDTYISIENAHLSAYDDTITTGNEINELTGRGGNDTLNAGGGNDILNGGAGLDTLNGGDGSDWASYEGSGSAVGVNLATGGFGGRAGGDVYNSIENVLGSDWNDTVIGDGNANRLDGATGNDSIQGAGGNDQLIGGAGADALNGGDGTDTANYADAVAAVALDLATGGTGGDAAGDAFASVEFVFGSAFADAITGDALNNRLMGGAGDDALSGGAGNDALLGGAGADTLTGGEGYDVFWFRDAGEGSDTITDFASGAGMTDRIWLGGASGVANWAGVLSAASDTAEGVLLSLANGSVLVAGVTTAMLNADDFLF